MALTTGFNDTIVAVATPAGVGGIGVVRISGPRAWEVGRALFRPARAVLPDPPPLRRMIYGHAVDPATGEALDEVLCVFFAAPRSYTTEDTVEIHCHPGPAVLSRLVELAIEQGCRPARAGEFTLRAFLGGRIDLSQAEAIARLVQARSKAEARVAMGLVGGGLGRELKAMRREIVEVAAGVEAAIDFPEDVEELAGAEAARRIRAVAARARALAERARALRAYAQGAVVVICGKPNVGKSSLFNALVGRERAIVTPAAGTTRDAIEEVAVLGGVACRLVDTAGLGVPAGEIEAMGMEVARQRLEAADGAIVVLDRSRELEAEDWDVLEATGGMRRVVAVNKCDQPPAWEPASELRGLKAVEVSALRGEGLEDLARMVGEVLTGGEPEPGPGEVVVGQRQAAVLMELASTLQRAAEALEKGAVEIASVELGQGLVRIGELDGQEVGEEVIETIFDMFCVGK